MSLIACPGMAQQPADGGQAEAVQQSPAVRDSQQPEPNAQGVRSPKASTNGNTAGQDLQSALADFYEAPPDVQGNRIPRPNEVGSNPDMRNEPTRSENPSDLSSREVK
ncbi:hypothetical protein [Arenibaculum pallidiluteum]|uniref:hypothetical protein n=1 Tax=Arenibaculum pallidiluteum TaxID=2812559 RepID=UPI001A95BA91|nr:hypothetical protein [Arenibaculum pallidiluteum]